MDALPRLLFAGFLVAHALIHLAYVAPRPQIAATEPAWPFETGRSWILDRLDPGRVARRPLGIALVAVTIAGFCLAALAILGVVPSALASDGLMVGASGSLALLLVFFHPWLVLGIAIDVAVMGLVLIARWTPG